MYFICEHFVFIIYNRFGAFGLQVERLSKGWGGAHTNTSSSFSPLCLYLLYLLDPSKIFTKSIRVRTTTHQLFHKSSSSSNKMATSIIIFFIKIQQITKFVSLIFVNTYYSKLYKRLPHTLMECLSSA